MRQIRLILAMLVLAAASNAAIIASGSLSASQANPIPAGTTYTPGPAGGGGIGAPISFATPALGTVTITITDCCLVGDVYELIFDGVSQGLTPAVAIGGPTGSSGSFVIPGVAAGSHSFDVWDIVLSYLGSASPFGGGTVTSNYSPAGLSYSVDFEETQVVPEPSTLTMGALGIAAVIAALRRRRQAE